MLRPYSLINMRLGPPDIHRLRAAQGWLELGNHLEAYQEMQHIQPACSTHPLVLLVRWVIYAKANKWEMAVATAEALMEVFPEDSYGWVLRSFALHEMKRTEDAWDRLLPGADRFPKEPMIPYHLACYASRLGRLDEARKWLRRAFEVGDGKDISLRALEDPDLEALWSEIA
jgi:tetratricopeptide (TPR) repeat protein